MKLLVLGGTSFLGRHIVAGALERGHGVTYFHRGKTNPGLFSDAEAIHGDRKTDLGLLAGRRFDAVIDTCGYLPGVVSASVDALKGSAGLYAFVSTISVYPTEAWPAVTEDSPVMRAADPKAESVTPETYGPLKAACDEIVLKGMPGRALVVRPGLIVGPHDPTDRFTYWVRRMARGGEVLAPLPADRRVSWIDARDLAAWMLTCCEAARSGLFNAVGPEPHPTMGQLLDACRIAGGADSWATWTTPEFLEKHEVAPWSDLPLWIPAIHDDFDCSRARHAGLTFRPMAETVRDTLWWDQTRNPAIPLRAGLTPVREREILAAWARDPA